MKKPFVQENFADNGAFSHYSLIDSQTGETLWSEYPDEEIVNPVNDFKSSMAFLGERR